MSTSRTIHDAIRDNNLDEVKRHLEKKPGDVNAQDQDGNTPLHLAAKNKNKEAIILLIQHGADVNITNKKRKTPAWVSHLKSYAEIRELINSEAKKYDAIEVAQGEVGLEFAEPVKKILKEKEKEKEKDKPQQLNNQYTNVSYDSLQAQTFSQAIEQGNIDKVKWYIYTLDPELLKKELIGGLHVAAMSIAKSDENTIEIIKALIEAGADVNRRDSDGNTPIDIAINNKNDEVAAFLTKYSAGKINKNTSMQKYIDCLRAGDVDQFSKKYIAHLKEVYEKSPLFNHNGKKRDFNDVRMAVLAIELAKTDIKPSDLKLAFHYELMFETIRIDTLSRSGGLDDQAAGMEQRMQQFRREAASAIVCIKALNIKDNNQSLSTIYQYLETSRAGREQLEKDIESEAGIPATSKEVDAYKLDNDSYKQFFAENTSRSSVGKEFEKRKAEAEAEEDKRSKPYLEMIRQLVAALPSTSGTKKIYDKILNDSNLREFTQLQDIVEAATKRFKVVGERENSLFKNIEYSKEIHRALSAIVLTHEYDNSSFKTAAEELIQQKKDRKDTLLKTLQDLGLDPTTPRKKM